MGKRIWVVGATDTVVDSDGKLRSDAKPEGTGGGDVVGVMEAVREELFDSSEGLECDGTLGGFREVLELEGVGNGNGVGIDGVFDGRVN